MIHRSNRVIGLNVRNCFCFYINVEPDAGRKIAVVQKFSQYGNMATEASKSVRVCAGIGNY